MRELFDIVCVIGIAIHDIFMEGYTSETSEPQ